MDSKNSMEEHYGLTLSALCKLMEYNGKEAVIEISKLGGVEEICEKLGTSPSQGITKSVEHYRDVFGSNTTSTKPKAMFLNLLWNAICDPIIIILLVVSIFQCFVLFCDVFKLLCVVIVVLVTATVDYYKERRYQCFRDDVIVSTEVTVIRNAVTSNIVVDDVVVGDVCIINSNNFVPADGILIESNGLKIDESCINGKSNYTRKNTHLDPMVLCGSEVIDGNGVMVVTAVGVNTRKGNISSMLIRMTKNLKKIKAQNENDVEPIFVNREVSILQRKVIRLFWKIIYMCLVIAGLMFVVLIAMFSIKVFVIEQSGWRNSYINNFVRYLILTLNVFSLFIPEGLPLTVVIVLAISIKKICRDKILVRRLRYCETMGNVTSICFDKTGTLTTNKMVVVQSYIGECQSTWTSEHKTEMLPNNILNFIAYNISLNSSATSLVTYTHNNDIIQIGNHTECALLDFVKKIGFNFQTIRESYETRQPTHVFPFDSDRKLMGTVISLDDGGFRLFVKGASEILLSKCKFMLGQNGKLMDMSNDLRERLIQDVIKPKTSERLRTISLAYRDFVTSKTALNETHMNGEPNWSDEINIVKNLTCIGILFIEDSIRSDVPNTIKNIKTSGITVRMITGDDIDTAKSVALQCGLVETNEENIALDALEFNRRIRDNNGVIQQHLFDEVYPTLRVLARASPIDKYNFIDGIIKSNIKKDREVVGMVGNGDGDALALKKADVGITFNQFSSDVAKDASDIILIGDKFGDILKTVGWGRNSYDSIAKFIQFILSVKLTLVILLILETIFINNLDFQNMYVFCTDLFLNISAFIPVYFTHSLTNDILRKQPHGRNEPIISKIMFRNIVGQSLYQFIVLLTLKLIDTRLIDKDINDENSLIYNTFVLMTLFNMFNARKLFGERNVFGGIRLNIPFCLFWIVIFIVHFSLMQLEVNIYVGSLNYLSWFWCLLLGVGILLWQQVLLVCVKDRKSKSTFSVV